jgi:hypothetical protein
MKGTLISSLVLASAVALAQGAPAKKPAGTRKPAATKPAEPDVARMPFTPDSIKQVMRYNSTKIQDCYEEHMASKDKKVEGKLMTSFSISPEGMVTDAKVLKKGTTLKDPGLHDCVVAVLLSMTFPQPTDGRFHPIEYPFNLKAVE